MASHQQKVLSVEENLKWLEKYKMGGEAGMCQELGLWNSRNQIIWKNRTKIISMFEQSRSGIKQFWKPEWHYINVARCKLFKQGRSDLVQVSGPALILTFFKF